jgi:hypothetical protein
MSTDSAVDNKHSNATATLINNNNDVLNVDVAVVNWNNNADDFWPDRPDNDQHNCNSQQHNDHVNIHRNARHSKIR